jgi:protein with PEP-CTERM/exosortase system signal
VVVFFRRPLLLVRQTRALFDDVSVTPAGVGVPDAGSTLPLLGFALLAFFCGLWDSGEASAWDAALVCAGAWEWVLAEL